MIRNDFVSNSSSSSFMIVGYCSNYDEIIENLESRGIDRGDEESVHCLCDLLIEKTNAVLGHEEEITDDPYNCWFGLHYVDMKDDETKIRIVEIYRNKEAYHHHLTTPHFQTYKQGTLHMVKSLNLLDIKPLDPDAMPAIFIK